VSPTTLISLCIRGVCILDKIKLNLGHAGGEHSARQRAQNPGEASPWLTKSADVTLMRPDSVLVEFGDPTRRIIPESPPEEVHREPRPDPPNHEFDTSYDLSN